MWIRNQKPCSQARTIKSAGLIQGRIAPHGSVPSIGPDEHQGDKRQDYRKNTVQFLHFTVGVKPGVIQAEGKEGDREDDYSDVFKLCDPEFCFQFGYQELDTVHERVFGHGRHDKPKRPSPRYFFEPEKREGNKTCG